MESDLTQDEHIDPAPFAFEPYYLASLLDPNSLKAPEGMGGIKGLLAGLDVDPTNGLSNAPTTTMPSLSARRVVLEMSPPREGASRASSFQGRERVYSSNPLPVRRSRSLLGLMWFALKDKVLVSP